MRAIKVNDLLLLLLSGFGVGLTAKMHSFNIYIVYIDTVVTYGTSISGMISTQVFPPSDV